MICCPNNLEILKMSPFIRTWESFIWLYCSEKNHQWPMWSIFSSEYTFQQIKQCNIQGDIGNLHRKGHPRPVKYPEVLCAARVWWKNERIKEEGRRTESIGISGWNHRYRTTTCCLLCICRNGSWRRTMQKLLGKCTDLRQSGPFYNFCIIPRLFAMHLAAASTR